MRTGEHRRKREAGHILVEACESVLGARGPTELAALMGRTKSWWSKFSAGVAAFPTWEELKERLPSGLTEPERERLHLGYRRAWLWLYDPELLERLDSPVPARPSLAELKTIAKTAAALGNLQADFQAALRLQKVLEMLLVARGIEAVSREELNLLLHCLDHQSICEGKLGYYPASIAVARRSVECQRRGGSRHGELLARHAVGLALHRAGVHHEAGFLPAAAREFEALGQEYRRLRMAHELIRAGRDRAVTMVHMGRQEEGEAGLRQAYEVPRQCGEDRFLTAMWLADATLRRGDVAQARRWLARLRVIARQYPDEVSRLLSYQFVSQQVTVMERAVADPRPRAKGKPLAGSHPLELWCRRGTDLVA